MFQKYSLEHDNVFMCPPSSYPFSSSDKRYRFLSIFSDVIKLIGSYMRQKNILFIFPDLTRPLFSKERRRRNKKKMVDGEERKAPVPAVVSHKFLCYFSVFSSFSHAFCASVKK